MKEKIRKATKKDIPQMLEIVKLNNPKYPKKLVLKEINEMFSDSLLKPTYIVAENKNEILGFGGFISSWVDSMIFNMFWLNTNPKYKKQGIGSKLIKERIKIIKKSKDPKAKMILISTKIPSFFKKFGFKTITKKYDKDYDLMSLKIK